MDDGMAVFMIHFNGQFDEETGNFSSYVGGETRIFRVPYNSGFDEFISKIHNRIGSTMKETNLAVKCKVPTGRYMDNIMIDIRDDEDLQGIIELFKNTSISLGVIYVSKCTTIQEIHAAQPIQQRHHMSVDNDDIAVKDTDQDKVHCDFPVCDNDIELVHLSQTLRHTPEASDDFPSHSECTPMHYYQVDEEEVGNRLKTHIDDPHVCFPRRILVPPLGTDIMARVKQSEELLDAIKARHAEEDRLKAEEVANAKAEEEAKKKSKQVAKKSRQAKSKGVQKKRKQPPRGSETGISLRDPAIQPPSKKSKVAPSAKGKGQVDHNSSSNYDSDDPLGPEPDATWFPAKEIPYVEEEADGDDPEIGEIGPTGHPRKELGSVPSSYKEKPSRNTGAPKPKKPTWAEFIKGKGFKAERFVKSKAFDTSSRVLKVIQNRKLGQWLVQWKGYKAGMVRNFYTVAVKEINNAVVTAKMSSNKTVTLTPDHIAEFLKIERPIPSEIEFPHPSHEKKSRKAAMEVIYSDPNPTKDDGQTFPIGYMSPDYATMNKIIHYNLYARGSESASKIDEVNLLIEFMGDSVIDVASWIFDDIVQFISVRSMNRLIPFPQMITQICIDQGITSTEPYLHGEGGITPAASSIGPRARAEAAIATQASQGMRARGASSSSAPDASTSLHVLITAMHADILEIKTNMGRLIRRQEIQWDIQMGQQAWINSLFEKVGIAPMPPIPTEFYSEFGASTPTVPPASEGGNRGEDNATAADVSVEPAVHPS